MVVKVVVQKKNKALIEVSSIEHKSQDSLTGLNTYTIISTSGEVFTAVSLNDLITRAAFGNDLECAKFYSLRN